MTSTTRRLAELVVGLRYADVPTDAIARVEQLEAVADVRELGGSLGATD